MSNNVNLVLEKIRQLVSEANELASPFPDLNTGFQSEVNLELRKPKTQQEQYLGNIKSILIDLESRLSS